MQVRDHALAQPVRCVVLAERMARVDVDQLLIDAFQDVFLDVGKVEFTNLVVQLAQRRRQAAKDRRVANPVEKITFNKIGDVQRLEGFAAQDAVQFVIARERVGLEHAISQQLRKHAQVAVDQIDTPPVVKPTVGELQKPLPLLECDMHGRPLAQRRYGLLHRLYRIDERARGVTEILLHGLQRRTAPHRAKQQSVQEIEKRLLVVSSDLELLDLTQPLRFGDAWPSSTSKSGA